MIGIWHENNIDKVGFWLQYMEADFSAGGLYRTGRRLSC
jgi:hypothetical protein